jgi:sugar phosphate isomerase/epimerase
VHCVAGRGPQLGARPAHRRPVDDGVRRAHRGDGPCYVHFELDLFWSWRGTTDPVDVLRRIDGRVRQYHVNDPNQAGSFEDPGRGLIDFVRIFQTQAVFEYIVERDHAGSPPRTPAQAVDTARVGYEYLASLSLRRRRRVPHCPE